MTSTKNGRKPADEIVEHEGYCIVGCGWDEVPKPEHGPYCERLVGNSAAAVTEPGWSPIQFWCQAIRPFVHGWFTQSEAREREQHRDGVQLIVNFRGELPTFTESGGGWQETKPASHQARRDSSPRSSPPPRTATTASTAITTSSTGWRRSPTTSVQTLGVHDEGHCLARQAMPMACHRAAATAPPHAARRSTARTRLTLNPVPFHRPAILLGWRADCCRSLSCGYAIWQGGADIAGTEKSHPLAAGCSHL
jgi:hypothetical protein